VAHAQRAEVLLLAHERTEVAGDAHDLGDAHLEEELRVDREEALAREAALEARRVRGRRGARDLERERERVLRLAEQAAAHAEVDVSEARAVGAGLAIDERAVHHEVERHTREDDDPIREAEREPDVHRELVLDDRRDLGARIALAELIHERIEGVVEIEARAEAQVSEIVRAAHREAVLRRLGGSISIEADALSGGRPSRTHDEQQREHTAEAHEIRHRAHISQAWACDARSARAIPGGG
jgi:hypothetical protein